MIYKMTLKDSVDTMTFNLLETPIVDKDIEGAVDNVTLDGNQYTDYLYLKKQYIQKWAIMCPDEYDELRGFYTRQFEDGEVPSYRVYYGANVTRDYTLNGDYFQFNAEGIETGMTLSQLLGNAEQTTYSGKNLFNVNVTPSSYVNTYTSVSGNTITVTSTSSSQTARVDLPFVFEANRQMTISFDAKFIQNGAGDSLISQVCLRTPGASDTIGNIVLTKTIGQTSHYSYVVSAAQSNNNTRQLWLYVKANALAGAVKVEFSNIQIEYGERETSYEPYVGGTPAPNPQFPQPISTVTGEQTVKITGKNLFGGLTLDRVEYCSYTLVDNILTITPSNTTNNQALHFYLGMPLQAGTYTLNSQTPISRSTQFRNTSNQVVANIGTAYQNKTFTLSDTATKITFNWLSTGSTTPFTVDLSTLQIELGNSVSLYEPYQGQSYEINLGKNLVTLADGVETSNGITSTTCGSTISYSGTPSSTWAFMTREYSFSERLPVGTYTFSIGEASSTNGFLIALYDADRTQTTYTILSGAKSVTFTTAKESVAYRFALSGLTAGTATNSSVSNLQLERGSTATSYAPYFTPIELAKIGNYQDYIWNDGGTWKIHKSTAVAVLNGTEAWAESGATHERFVIGSAQTTFSLLAKGTPSYKSKCDHFTFQEGGTAWTGIGRCGFDGLGTFWCMISGMSSLADFKTWLGANNVRVHYPLATPTDTEITDETLLSQLNFLASLYEGENNISLVGTGAQGEMEVFIRDVMSVETDVVLEVPVRLTLTDDGVINACGCRRNVQLTMRETTE